MNTITPSINKFNNIQPSYKNNLAPKMNISQPSFKGGFNRMPEVMDRAIGEMMQSNPLDIVAKIKFHKILDKCLPEIMKPENFINNGQDSKVYKISNNFVAKIKRGKNAGNATGIFDVASTPSKEFQSLDFYYGEPVIKLGNVEILKNATPNNDFITCGVEYPSRRGLKHLSADEKANLIRPVIETCAELPQESYDEFAFNLRRLNGIKSKKMFDIQYDENGKKVKKFHIGDYSFIPDTFNPNNLIVSNGKFKLVDELMPIPMNKPNTMLTMVEPLLVRLAPFFYAPENNGLAPMRKQIFKKCLLAAEKNDLPLENCLKDNITDTLLSKTIGSTLNVCDVVGKMRQDGENIQSRIAYINKSIP